MVAEGDRRAVGPFDLQFFAVNHSIPDALAVGIRTPAGTVLHTGDIKLDQLPLDGRLTDLGGFSKLGDEGVDLFLVDSTNAEVPGFVAPEREIGPVMDTFISKATQRVIVASFASHVHRVQQMIDSADRNGRKIAFVGRSMVRNMQIAQDLGLLTVPDGLVRSLDKVLDLPPDQVMLISTGSQGEPLSALSRMSRGEHRQVNLRSGDTVILASSMIPGNETSVFTVINELAKVGVTVVHQGVAKVHVSGHASAGELLYLYNAVRPKNVIPVHGEWRHLRAQAKLAVATGVPPERVVLAPNGTVVDLINGKARISRAHRGRHGLRRRQRRRRRRRGHPVRPADPRRGRLHLDHRGHRFAHRAGGGVADHLRPRLLRRPEGAGRGGAAGRGRAGPAGGRSASPTRTGSHSRCAGSSAAGWATPTGAGR